MENKKITQKLILTYEVILIIVPLVFLFLTKLGFGTYQDVSSGSFDIVGNYLRILTILSIITIVFLAGLKLIDPVGLKESLDNKNVKTFFKLVILAIFLSIALNILH